MFGPNTIDDEIAKIEAEHEAAEAEAEAEARVAAKAEVAAEVVAEKRLEMESILLCKAADFVCSDSSPNWFVRAADGSIRS